MSRYGIFGKSIVIIVLSCLAILAIPASSQTNEAVETLAYYFDLLISGNLESARGLWTEPVVERAERFDIEYSNIPFKLDCNSPIVCNLEVMRDYVYQAAKSVEELPGGEFFKLEYSTIIDGKNVTHLYYAYFDGSYFWLTHPQEYYCKGWPVIESQYFRIHYHPDVRKYLYSSVLKEADRFVESIADSLGLSSAVMETLKNKKIEYFYCDTDSVIQQITGTKMKGSLDLATNDVISAFFPHYHEIVHLLINLKLQHIPLYTQPLMREGIAVYYGGRWGKAQPTLYYLGGFLQDQRIVEIDSILTMSRFEQQATADMAYPIAGLFTVFLMEKIGLDKYFDLYRELSGEYDTLYLMKAPRVKKALYEALGMTSWEDLMKGFTEFLGAFQNTRSVLRPGGIEHGKSVAKSDQLMIQQNDDWLAVKFNGNGTEPLTGNLLFGKEDKLAGQQSLLFNEQYEGAMQFEGYRYGLKFDTNEAGLYDYVTNQLVAKYIWGITPSDEYKNAEGTSIAVKFQKSLFDKAIPSEGKYKLLSY